MGNQNFIVINGKKYDAVTGKLVEQSTNTVTPVQTVVVAPKSNVGVVDGFVKPKNHSNINRNPAHHVVKNPQRSQTLARKAVNKPTTKHSGVKNNTKPSVVKSKLGASPRREYLAKEVHKSPHIQKYGVEQARSSVVKKNVALPVKPEPVQSPNSTENHSQAHQKSAHSNPSKHQAASRKMIEAALANANSHNEKAPVFYKKTRRKKLSKKLGISSRALAVSSGVLAVVLLSGFYAIQNVPNLSMKVAATRAGFDARLPGYRPSGFSFKGPINYSPGEVNVSFASNSDDREYSFKQRNSNWNSDALLSNFIEAENKQYQTYLDRGRTLYIYDGSNATWIDDGIWYVVEGNSEMTTDQLIRIASSI